MNLNSAKLMLIASLLFVPIVLMAIHSGGNSQNLALKALSPSSSSGEKAIAELRAMGPKGMDIFLSAHANDFKNPKQANLKQLHRSLDLIAGQKDAYYSRLYWYDDLEKAKSEALVQEKPILSLRMLGNLTEDLSCANSRLFRTTLYANQTVANYLRENYILHWSSERPVPIVTVDYGNGRTLKRTLTGNSIHYVLSPEGKPLEAIPGLYTPKEFLNRLKDAKGLFTSIKDQNETNARNLVINFHKSQRKNLALLASGKNIEVAPPPFIDPVLLSALEPQFMAIGKGRVETPLLLEIKEFNPADLKQTPKKLNEKNRGPSLDPWENIKGEKVNGTNPWFELVKERNIIMEFDSSSRSLILKKNPVKYADPTAFETDLNALMESTPVETIRNEIMLHLQLHDWFILNDYQEAFTDLNTKVYDELFLTPRSDKWLGLLPADVFSGIDDDGIINNQ